MEFAYEDVVQGLAHKCTLQDTLPATVILNYLIYAIDTAPDSVSPYVLKYRFLLRLLDVSGLIGAIAESAYFVNVLLYKTDGFTLGKVLGKAIKLTVQMYLYLKTSN